MKNILLIGGEGYIGNIVSQKLLSDGYKVTSFDRLLYNNSNCVLSKICEENYSFIFGDMLDAKNLTTVITNSDALVLLAGLVGDPITKKYPKEAEEINHKAIKNFINLCKNKNVDKLLFISTCSNYGLLKENEMADENYKLNPLSNYFQIIA